MSLHQQYTPPFEKVWSLYPKWPIGRSKKHDGFLAWERCHRILKFTESDVDFICNDIEQRIKTCVTWQPGNKFGPPMFATYCNKRLWTEPYEKKGQDWHTLKYRDIDKPAPVVNRVAADRARAEAIEALEKMGLRH